MVKIEDSRDVLAGYYVTHTAIRSDLERIQEYRQRTSEARKAAREAFSRWFDHHRLMLDQESRGAEKFFRPRVGKFMTDQADVLEHSEKQRKKLDQLGAKILSLLKGEDDAELLKTLDEYCGAVREYLEYHETILLPNMLQYFIREDLKRAETEFARSRPLSDLPEFFPWILSRAVTKDRTELYSRIPLPLRWLYTHIWEPRYKRKYRF